jgi:hypothetical protein
VCQVRLLKELGFQFPVAVKMLADLTKEAYPHATLLMSTLHAYNNASAEVGHVKFHPSLAPGCVPGRDVCDIQPL